MNIAVIGGTGFIGAHVTAQLVKLGYRVMVFHRGTREAKAFPGITVVLGERGNLSAFSEEFRRFNPDVVVDVIGYSKRDARELVAAFKDSPARVVVLSSCDVYRNRTGLFGVTEAPPDPLPLTEDSPLRTRFYPYADRAKEPDPETTYEKIQVEETAMSGLPGRVTILRLCAVYGPGDQQHRMWPYLKRMLDHRPFILVERDQAAWLWTRGYIENVAAAVVGAVLSDAARGKIYNIGESEALSESEWISRIARIAGWKGRIIPLPNAEMPAHLRTAFDWNYGLSMSTRKMRSELGFEEPVSPDLALRRTIEWESRNPPATPDPKAFDYAAEEDAAISRPR
jgi:nucleoside-diphosphate-sugar epimerase